MKIADFRKMKLMMNMTLSGSDQEKLTAIEKVNEIIARSNTTWDKILDRVIKVDVVVESVEDATAGKLGDVNAEERRRAFRRRIDDAFAAIEKSDPRGSWADFVADLKSQWERNGRLSEAQTEAVLKGARNAENRR